MEKFKNLEGKVDCLRRLNGKCQNCKYDFNGGHHPNNYDCPRAIIIRVYKFKVKNG